MRKITICDVSYGAFEEMVRTARENENIGKYVDIYYDGDSHRGTITIERLAGIGQHEKMVFKTLLGILLRHV